MFDTLITTDSGPHTVRIRDGHTRPVPGAGDDVRRLRAEFAAGEWDARAWEIAS